MKIRFVNDGAWRDFHGTHRRYEIRRGKEVLGRLEGESASLWPWEVCDPDRGTLSKHDTFAEAKAAARARWEAT
jgi:hypothetical protein